MKNLQILSNSEMLHTNGGLMADGGGFWYDVAYGVGYAAHGVWEHMQYVSYISH